jgi:hypothetical protein
MGNGYVDIVRPRAVLAHDSMVGAVILPFVIAEATFDLDHEAQIPAIEAALRSGVAPIARVTRNHLAPLAQTPLAT